MKNIPLFKKYEDIFLKNSQIKEFLLKNLVHKHFRKRTPVVNIGDHAQSYFIILKGTVFVLIPKDNSSLYIYKARNANWAPKLKRTKFFKRAFIDNANIGKVFFYPLDQYTSAFQKMPFKKQLFKIRMARTKAALAFLFNPPKQNYDYSKMTDEEFLAIKYPTLKVIRKLFTGDQFGEIALITNGLRQATVVCQENSHFMILSKAGFDKVLTEYHEIAMNQKVKFYRQFSIFAKIPTGSLYHVINSAQTLKFTKNMAVYKEQDPVESVYFVKEGDVQLSQVLNLKEG